MKNETLPRMGAGVSAPNPKESTDLGELFDAHIEKEFADHDVEATMQTMVAEP